jgi:hypothetical protein
VHRFLLFLFCLFTLWLLKLHFTLIFIYQSMTAWLGPNRMLTSNRLILKHWLHQTIGCNNHWSRPIRRRRNQWKKELEETLGTENTRVPIQKPAGTYAIVSYYRKAVCLNLFAALPMFLIKKFTIFISHCLCHFWTWNAICIWEQKLLKSSFKKA